jgi:hypothetical protein
MPLCVQRQGDLPLRCLEILMAAAILQPRCRNANELEPEIKGGADPNTCYVESAHGDKHVQRGSGVNLLRESVGRVDGQSTADLKRRPGS